MSKSTSVSSQIDTQHIYQIESLYKPDKYINTERYSMLNHNVAVHDKTGKSDQNFLFIPSTIQGQFRLVTLRNDVGPRYFVSIGSNTNIVTWHNAGDDTQRFKAVQAHNGEVAFTADNGKHFLNVADNGNMHSYQASNGQPKRSQLFRLHKGEKWSSPIKVPEQFNEFRKHRNKFDGMMAAIFGHAIEANVAQEMVDKIDTKTWHKMISAFKRVEKGTEDEKSNVLREILLTIGFSVVLIAAAVLALVVLIGAIVGAVVSAPWTISILALIAFLLSLFITGLTTALTLMWIWWKDVESPKMIQLSV